ncbi:RNA polymerase sigma factor [Sphingobacterium sp. JB170]|uniref:RNA polymerase sigma factor n=1 Tax=Sphingobacterium sp. JB170 TaxID=1434842 RepID=UPI00097EE639|nr:sigma-70 family RNA polymerase sigma factor [Sphingobacterium sp. JB170]SJN19175.1 RNA polymerase ECF-type sigma factor [Sphingobacterium sp. JB170]
MDSKELFQLFVNVKSGDHKSFDLLYHHTWRPLFDLAISKTKDEQEAKDIVQEVYAKVWNKRESLEIHTSIGAYLYKMTKHEVIYRMRSAMLVLEKQDLYKYALEELSTSLEDDLLVKELKEQWEAEIRKLPVKQRDIYIRFHKFDHSISEIARELGIAEQTVKNQLVTAKKKIRPVIEASLALYIISMLG